MKYKKREEIKPAFISHTVNRLLPKIQTARGLLNLEKNMAAIPRSQTTDIQICMLAFDGLGRLQSESVPTLEHQSE